MIMQCPNCQHGKIIIQAEDDAYCAKCKFQANPRIFQKNTPYPALSDFPTLRLLLDGLIVDVYRNAWEHGWHDEDRNDGECIALMHSELSEALEALRNGNPKDAHCPEFSALEVELADVVLRVLDFAGMRNLNVAGAIIAKHKYNQQRPRKHGGKRF